MFNGIEYYSSYSLIAVVFTNRYEVYFDGRNLIIIDDYGRITINNYSYRFVLILDDVHLADLLCNKRSQSSFLFVDKDIYSAFSAEKRREGADIGRPLEI